MLCRMLGYEYALQVSSGRKYVKTKGYIVLNLLRCRGSEIDIMNCPHRPNFCSNNDGVGVVCYRPTVPKGNKIAYEIQSRKFVLRSFSSETLLT